MSLARSHDTRSSLRAIIDIHAGVEQGHGEREPRAREGGKVEVGVEDAEPLHRGVAQGHRLLRVRAADDEPHLLGDLDLGPGHEVVHVDALLVQTLRGQLVTVGAEGGQLQSHLHVLHQLVNQVITVIISKHNFLKL